MAETRPIDYVAFYCEENIHRLLSQVDLGDGAEVVFVSNAAHEVACWGQRLARSPEEPLVWDYHVVAAAPSATDGAWRVWDLDAIGGAPLAASAWLARTFLAPGVVRARYRPQFRVAPRVTYLAEFATDRSHMRRADGAWRRPPPPWAPPGAPAMNLSAWRDMTPDRGPGVVHDRAALEVHWNVSQDLPNVGP